MDSLNFHDKYSYSHTQCHTHTDNVNVYRNSGLLICTENMGCSLVANAEQLQRTKANYRFQLEHESLTETETDILIS